VGEAPHLLAGEDALHDQADLLRDMAGDEIVVTGDDLERDPVVPQLRDRVADALFGRIAEQDQALEDKVVLDLLGRGQAGACPSRSRDAKLLGCQRAGPDRDESEAVREAPSTSLASRSWLARRRWAGRRGPRERCRAEQDRFRRSLVTRSGGSPVCWTTTLSSRRREVVGKLASLR